MNSTIVYHLFFLLCAELLCAKKDQNVTHRNDGSGAEREESMKEKKCSMNPRVCTGEVTESVREKARKSLEKRILKGYRVTYKIEDNRHNSHTLPHTIIQQNKEELGQLAY